MDPTESQDLSELEPTLKQSLLDDYAAYELKNDVIEVPPGYDIIKQANAAKKN